MTNQPVAEVRSARPSWLLRIVQWVIARRTEIFPRKAEDVHPFLHDRKYPPEAPVPAGVEKSCQIERWSVAGQDCVTLHPKSGKGAKHILYFHGGGFVLPIVKEHWTMLAVMVEKFGVSITAPLYNLVPEHSYRDADVLADQAYDRLTEEWAPENMILAGDSAGGHMALALALRLARDGKPQAGRLLLYSPWLDLTLADEGARQVEPRDVMLKVDPLRLLGKIWADERDPAAAECSPLYASDAELAQLPPTQIFVGQNDIFVVDCRTFADRLSATGVSTQLFEYAGAPHVYMIVTPSREAKDTFNLVDAFLKE